MADRAVFLSRDGVLIADKGYLTRPEDVEILPGVPEALLRLQAKGWRLVVVTNKLGIGLAGLLTVAVTDRMRALLVAEGIHLAGVFHCPHVPDDGCDCRMPRPGMLQTAARTLGIDLAQSVMIGDRALAVEAGRAAGCRLSLFSFPGYLSTQAAIVSRIGARK